MSSNSPRVRSLLRQANKVANAGKRAAAENLYRQIIEEAPDSAEAWVGLGKVVKASEEKEANFRRALEIDPENKAAKVGLGIDIGDIGTINGNESDDTQPEQGEIPGVIGQVTEDLAPSEFISESILEGDKNSQLAVEEHQHHAEVTLDSEEVLYCTNHPSRQTHLRCNRCGKPICSSCAVPTPVGYRCPECIREQESVFYSATVLDYLVVILVTIPLSLLGGWLATLLGFFTIFLGAAAGSFIGRITFRAAGRRRGRWLPQLVGVLVVIGGILPAVPHLLALLQGQFTLQIVWTGIYILAASGSAYYQMK